MITGIDHLIILVNDLDAAMATYRGIGFQVEAGGVHPRFGSHNALVPLTDGSFLELVAFQDRELAARTFWTDAVKRLQLGEGFGDYAVSSSDLAADVRQIRERGLALGDPQPGERERPDGRHIAWHTSRPPSALGSILPFLIQDDTPRELRIEPPREGLGNGARIKEIVVGVAHAEAARDAFRRLLDVEPRLVRNSSGELQGYRLVAPWGSFVLVHPDRERNALADQLRLRGEGVHAVTLSVENVNRARTEMSTRHIAVIDDPVGFLIAPASAHGARIRFVQAAE